MKRIILISVILVLIFSSIIVGVKAFVAEKPSSYSYTTAVCYGNSCADFYVECNGDEIISNSQITGWITFSENWEDPRGDGKRELCN